MAEQKKKDEDTGRKDAGDQNTDDTDDDDDDDDSDDSGNDEEAGWTRLGEMVETAVGKKLDEWQSNQKKTSSSSRRKVAPKKPARKQGFLTGQFFSNLNPTDDDGR